MTLGDPIPIERMVAGSCWQLCAGVNGFGGSTSEDLVTQALRGRSFQVMDDSLKDYGDVSECFRFKVKLLEDGYICWFEFSEVVCKALARDQWQPVLLSKSEIQKRIPNILSWIEAAAQRNNQYLWGGTIGPDFDCSGLVQTAFATQDIWLPRDAYQQESFCQALDISVFDFQLLCPGDLLFFGTSKECTHVAIYKGEGIYFHSSGINNGRNGIGSDGIGLSDDNPVASYYRSHLRGAGRVVHCHDGMTLP